MSKARIQQFRKMAEKISVEYFNTVNHAIHPLPCYPITSNSPEYCFKEKRGNRNNTRKMKNRKEGYSVIYDELLTIKYLSSGNGYLLEVAFSKKITDAIRLKIINLIQDFGFNIK